MQDYFTTQAQALITLCKNASDPGVRPSEAGPHHSPLSFLATLCTLHSARVNM